MGCGTGIDDTVTYVVLYYWKEVMDMAQTKQSIRVQWDRDHYRQYAVKLRTDSDSDEKIINFMEDMKDQLGGTTQIIREALTLYIQETFPYYGEE